VDDSTLAVFGGRPAVNVNFLPFLPLSEAERAAADRSLRETPLTTVYGGHDIGRFEEGFARKFGSPFAVAMSSGTASLHAAVVALDLRPRDEVLVPAYTFIASVSVVVQQGAVPVFCDIDPDTLGIGLADCAARMTPRTRGVLPVHLYGMPAAPERLAGFCRERGIWMVEDCACATGAQVNGRRVGTFGDAGCFSFNVGKLLRTGEGGMAITANPELAELLRCLRVNGLRPSGGVNNVACLGFNYTMPQIQAAIGVEQLKVFDELLARRARNARILVDECRGLPVQPLVPAAGVVPVAYMFPLLLDPAYRPLRGRVLAALRAEGVPADAGYGEPLYRIGYLQRYLREGPLPVAEDVTSRVICFDPSPFLGDDDMRQVGRGFRKVLSQLGEVARMEIPQTVSRWAGN
jgi:perosamine synthetase